MYRNSRLSLMLGEVLKTSFRAQKAQKLREKRKRRQKQMKSEIEKSKQTMQNPFLVFFGFLFA